jgi:hypothetical protein
MHDRPQSNLSTGPAVPADPEATSGFRETTLYLFRPRDAEALRHVGRMLYNLVLEGSPFFGEPGESTIRRELEAALADAVHLRDFFWGIGRQVEQSELPAWEAQLSLFAREMADGMDRVINATQEALR